MGQPGLATRGNLVSSYKVSFGGPRPTTVSLPGLCPGASSGLPASQFVSSSDAVTLTNSSYLFPFLLLAVFLKLKKNRGKKENLCLLLDINSLVLIFIHFSIPHQFSPLAFTSHLTQVPWMEKLHHSHGAWSWQSWVAKPCLMSPGSSYFGEKNVLPLALVIEF